MNNVLQLYGMGATHGFAVGAAAQCKNALGPSRPGCESLAALNSEPIE